MNSFDTFLKKELNPPQHQAVTHENGSLLVVAGAGSGKTRVITARIAHQILNHGIEPSAIVALTFTNRAAHEMKARLLNFLGTEAPLPFVGTFHSFCLQLLRSNPTLAPLPNFVIFDGDDQLALVKKIIKQHGLEKEMRPAQAIHLIGSIKNTMAFGSDTELSTLTPLMRDVYFAYEREKEAARGLDFNDLLLHALTMFKTNAYFREQFQAKTRHILVDEYQDTNVTQLTLLKYMAHDAKHKTVVDSMCAVGDEDQSIYSWRGACPTNMLTFEKDFSPVTKIKIEQNYRSVQPIIQAANAVIALNQLRNPKKLWSDRPAKNRIIALTARSDYQEAEAIAALLKSLPKGKRLDSVAILYRAHFQSRILEEVLISHNIPYRILGSIHFYARKEIKDLLAYLRLIVNPHDRISLFRVLNTPSRGLGAQFEELVTQQWRENPFFTFKQLLEHMLATPECGITGKKAVAAREFLKIFDGFSKDNKPHATLEQILQRSEYLNFLRTAHDTQEAQDKIENVRELSRSIYTFETMPADKMGTLNKGGEKTIETLLHEIALLQEKIESAEGEQDRVSMMTLHAVKGLEFDTIIMVGLEEGVFPSTQSLHEASALEDERRLYYVGLTRAREYLVLSHALYRNIYGQLTDQEASRFLQETPKSLLQPLNLAHTDATAARRAFTEWFGGSSMAILSATIPAAKLRPALKSTGDAKQAHSAPQKTTRRSSEKAPQPPKSFTAQAARADHASEFGPWRKNQVVMHKTFGRGIVTTIEKKNGDEYYITALFKIGRKKVLSKFLEKA